MATKKGIQDGRRKHSSAGMSEEAVFSKTGRVWDGYFKLLDKAGRR